MANKQAEYTGVREMPSQWTRIDAKDPGTFPPDGMYILLWRPKGLAAGMCIGVRRGERVSFHDAFYEPLADYSYWLAVPPGPDEEL